MVCNPPYGGSGTTLISKSEPERIARHESDLSCEEVAAAADKLLKFGGKFCVVFPAPRAYEMMSAMDKFRLAPKRLRSVHHTLERAPKIVLIEAVKGGGKGLHWMSPLILEDAEGKRTAEWYRIYGTEYKILDK